MPPTPTPQMIPGGGGAAPSVIGRDGYEDALLTGIFQSLEQQVNSLARVGLQALVLWSLGAVLGAMLVTWGLRQGKLLGQTSKAQRRSGWALWLVFWLVCWPSLALPPTAKAVAHRVREVVAGASDRIGLTQPVGAAILSPVTAQMWQLGMLAPPVRLSPQEPFRSYDERVDAAALLDPAKRHKLLSGLSPDAIWAQGEPVRAAVFAAQQPLPGWLLRYLVERGHRMLCDDLSMYAAIVEGLTPSQALPTDDSPRRAFEPAPLLPLSEVHRFAGRAFFQTYAEPLVEDFMAHIEWLGRLLAFASFSTTALSCYLLTRPRRHDAGDAVPPLM